ncbi:MAG: TonB-dependent receptor, partial [Bacteroidota bacterium]|nr:TonB-dependent receptor [Bacteroidota bacterium]
MKIYLILLFFSSVIIKKGQTDTSTVLIQEVVITTQRNPKETTNIPYSISFLDRKSLDDFSPRTTPEALMNMNGLFVQKTNHGGG